MTPTDLTRRSFLRVSAAFAAAPFVPSLRAAENRPLLAYVGTYSSPLHHVRPGQVDLPPGNGRGIHVFEVDRATGALTPRSVYESGTSPSCLAVNSAGTCLYSGNETDSIGEENAGSVSAFAIDPKDGKLTLLNTVSSGGAGPAFISIHPSGRFALVANYFGGSVAVFPILPDGRLGAASDIKNDAGTVGPKKATGAPTGSFAFSGHDVPHAHMIQADPSGKFVLSVDLGLDQILVWRFDSSTGVLTPNDPATVAFPAGDGPRHFAFNPSGRSLYSLQEEGSNIVVFSYDAEKGRLTARQTISSLPAGFAGSSFGSEIAVSKDGKFVYAGNRLHDSIAIFAVGADGMLKFLGEEWTRGDYPRSFAFEPAGQILFSCNQRGDNIAAFRVDQKSGGLKFTGQYTAVGNPSMMVFVELGKGA